jgi:hypothetical protein
MQWSRKQEESNHQPDIGQIQRCDRTSGAPIARSDP